MIRTMVALILLIMFLPFISCSAEKLTSLSVGQLAAPPEFVTLKINNYRPQNGHVFQNLFVSNYSVRTQHGQLHWSTSRDGMPDTLKNDLHSRFGFLNWGPETTSATGFADLVLFQAGIDLASQPLLYCSSNLMNSTTNDALVYPDKRLNGNPVTFIGLRDCEKVYMGLNPSKFDYNNNGVPDYVELQCGMNPANPNQAFVSTASDGVTDIEKCKRHIPIDENAYTQPNQMFAYRYNVQVNQDGSSDITISNIPILMGGEGNFIAMYVTETNSQTSASELYTAYTILKDGSGGKTIQFNYWATDPSKFYNSEIIAP